MLYFNKEYKLYELSLHVLPNKIILWWLEMKSNKESKCESEIPSFIASLKFENGQSFGFIMCCDCLRTCRRNTVSSRLAASVWAGTRLWVFTAGHNQRVYRFLLIWFKYGSKLQVVRAKADSVYVCCVCVCEYIVSNLCACVCVCVSMNPYP